MQDSRLLIRANTAVSGRSFRRGAIFAAAGIGALFVSVQAFASGFMIRENSAITLGTGYAGMASRAESAATAFNNPAGMTRLTNDEVEGGISVIVPYVKFDGSATLLGGPISGENGNGGRTAFVPNLSWVFGINDRLKGGISVTVPFGNSIVYDRNWPGRYLGIKTSLITTDINPNIAFKVSDMLSVGAGVSAQYGKIEFTTAIPQFAILRANVPDALLRFNADDWAYGYNLGALLELPDTTRIGLTYRSRMNHKVEGDLEFIGASPLLGLTNSAASAGINLPAYANLSITKDLPSGFSLSGEVQFTQWSVFKQVAISSQNQPIVLQQNYRDAWLFAVGGEYRLDDLWTLRGGLGVDFTPVTDRYRAVSLPDEDRYYVTLGFGYRLNDRLYLDGAYELSLPGERPDMSQSVNNTDPFTHAIVLNGKYNVFINIAALSLRYRY